MLSSDEYAIKGNSISEQAEPSTANRAAGTVQMRILIELQVISRLLAMMNNETVDLAVMRQDVADEIS